MQVSMAIIRAAITWPPVGEPLPLTLLRCRQGGASIHKLAKAIGATDDRVEARLRVAVLVKVVRARRRRALYN
jgi:hypothetical protein